MYGLVLEGGGGRGAYQAGACKAIKEMGLEIGMVAGCSVGALNGAMVVQGDTDRAYDIWYDIDPASVIDFVDSKLADYAENGFRADSLRDIVSHIKKVVAYGGLNVTPLERLVKGVLDEKLIRTSKIGFGVVTVDLTQRKAVEIYKEMIPDGQLADYVIASASFPAFKRTIIDGRSFIDGALYNVLPVNLVSDKGFKDIIVLRTYGLGIKRRFSRNGLNIVSISPSDSLGSTLDFTNKTSRRNLKLGYEDASRVLEKLSGSAAEN
ncbi:MAG TPA: patatin-like phospholipase family protein [Clostridia bacterium]|nr:patatin-like phospholipase family protein [Clostridia bacterium]